jgi:hypothetical protein
MITGSQRATLPPAKSYAVIACDFVDFIQVILVYAAQVTGIRSVLHGATLPQALLVRVQVLGVTKLQPTPVCIFKVIEFRKKGRQLRRIKLPVILFNTNVQRVADATALYIIKPSITKQQSASTWVHRALVAEFNTG